MSKKRVYELARDLQVDSKDIINLLKQHDIAVDRAINWLDDKAISVVKANMPKLRGEEQHTVHTESKQSQAPKQGGHKTEAPSNKNGGAKHDSRKQEAHKQNEHNEHNVGRHEGQNRGQQQQGHGQNQNHRTHGNDKSNHGQQHKQGSGTQDGYRHVDIAKSTGESNTKGGDVRKQSMKDTHTNQGKQKQANGQKNGNSQGNTPRNDKRNGNGANNPSGNNKKGKNKGKDKNRAKSLLSTSLAKDKNKVKLRNEQNRQMKEEERRKAEAAIATEIELSGPLTVKELADKMGREVSEIIKKLMMLGVMATINQEVDVDTATILAEEFGVKVIEIEPEQDPTEIVEVVDAPETLKARPPVVTIMGHVDHGKTSLLDVIRQTNVTASEAGGITQHIGAYMVRYNNNKITFLDTPGHEAFTAMRLRGAQSTDIAVLVVAADDGVMPQTIEAINHAKSADVPIIVAINKMDKPGANPDHVKQQLSEHGLLPEEWGGDIIMVPVSAKKKMGIEDLLENILLVAEVLELKANPNRNAQGVVIEAKLDKGRGPVCTVLVQKGTLHIGDSVIAGTAYGKVRAMTNERGEKVKIARPSTPVEVLGLSDVPQAGEIMDAVDDSVARNLAEKRVDKQRISEMQSKHKVTLDDIFNQIQQGELKDLNIIIKADVQGSVEALRQSLEKIENPEVRISIVHSAVGAINESDIMLASAANAIIIGFNVRPDSVVTKAAEKENVDLRTYRVIYDAINDIENAMRGMLTPEFKEVVLGRAEVRQVINTPKAVVAGSYVTDGKITNKASIRLIRDGIVVHEGTVDSLRRFKDEVKEVAQSFECGISIERFRDIKEGDVIEAFTMEEITPEL